MKKWLAAIAAFSITAVSLGAAACAPSTDCGYDCGYRLWTDWDISDYSYDIQIMGFLPGGGSTVRIEVRGGAAVSHTQGDTTTGELPDSVVTLYDTIDKLFARIRDAYVNKAASISAVYDPGYGYPLHASVDPIKEAIDEEWAFTVTGFEPAG